MIFKNKTFLVGLHHSVQLLALSSVLGLSGVAMAGPAPSGLTLERVFSDPDLSGPKLTGAKLSPDGELVTWLQAKADKSGVQDLWAAPVKGGAPFVLMDADKFSSNSVVLSEAEKSRRERMRVSGRGVVDYGWDRQGKALLVPLDGDIYYVDRATRMVKQLTHTPEDEVDARLSPDGRRIAYVRSNQLFMRDLVTGAEQALTPQASEMMSYGVAEFIAQEELDRHEGYWWSPTSQAVAYTRVDETGVDVVTRLEIGGDEVKSVSQRYPRAGRPNAVVALFVTGLGANAPVRIDLGANNDIYLARVNWSQDGHALYIQRLSRDQKRLDLLKADPLTGTTTLVLSETSDTWVELGEDFTLLRDGRFLWTSERDGNKHIYLYAADGTLLRQVTHGDWPVARIDAVDEATGQVWFEASKDTPIERRLYRVNFSRPADPVGLTPSGGWWTAQLAADGSAFIGSYSDPATPPQSALYDAYGKRLRWLQANAVDAEHPYAPYKDLYPQPEFGTLKAADGQTLHHLMLKPRGFDPAKKYPVVVMVYGGPARALVQKTWVTPSLRLYQEAGFIVFMIDNRGTPGRSYAFGHSIYKRFGGPDIEDQVLGANWLKTLPYVDGAHMGIFGWSQGGFDTLMALTVRDSPFIAGVAGAPPTQWGLYDTAYTERYMSTPEANKDGYAASDILNRLDNLKPGSLLLMHGMSDDNVVLAHSTRLVRALQTRGIAFEMMFFPGERHGLKGNARNRLRTAQQLDFFRRKLQP
jgi:dipeptidyl-peptidase 4